MAEDDATPSAPPPSEPESDADLAPEPEPASKADPDPDPGSGPEFDPPAEPGEPSEPEERPEAEPEPEPEPSEPEPEPTQQSPSLDDIAAQIRAVPIGSFLLSTISTLASIAYGKLDAGQLDEARGAIDAIAALLPVLEGRVEPELKRDFDHALTNLQLAYADASARASS